MYRKVASSVATITKDKNRAQKPAAMGSCFDLVRPHQHSTASR